MFGIQWDLVCKFLEENSSLDEDDIRTDSSSWGNYKGHSIRIDSEHAWGLSEGEEKFRYLPKGTIIETKLLTTGASEDTKVLNIYDFAGNGHEWTLEYCKAEDLPTSVCGYRSGYWLGDGRNGFSAAERDSGFVNSQGKEFRPCLF